MSEDQNIPSESLKEGVPDGNSSFPEDKGAPVVQPEPGQIPVKELQSETNMEVHHHSHDHGRRSWKSYFWEFLMLFLAVFCGFLAEYQLEHTIEHQRERKYAQTLYDDLKADTSLLNTEINERNFVTPKIDSFRLLVHTKGIDDIPSGTWYYFGRFGTRNTNVSLQDATLQQLLSSGGLRYFKKYTIVYAIASYDQALRAMREMFVFQNLMYSDLVKARNVIFDAYYFDEIMTFTASNEKVDSFKKKSFTLLSNKKEDFIQYANFCQIRSYNMKYAQIRIEKAVKRAETLLALLKEEYHLE
jgi:hypothetical protein